MAGFNINEMQRSVRDQKGYVEQFNKMESDGVALNSMTHPRLVWYKRPYWAFLCWWRQRFFRP